MGILSYLTLIVPSEAAMFAVDVAHGRTGGVEELIRAGPENTSSRSADVVFVAKITPNVLS